MRYLQPGYRTEPLQSDTEPSRGCSILGHGELTFDSHVHKRRGNLQSVRRSVHSRSRFIRSRAVDIRRKALNAATPPRRFEWVVQRYGVREQSKRTGDSEYTKVWPVLSIALRAASIFVYVPVTFMFWPKTQSFLPGRRQSKQQPISHMCCMQQAGRRE